MRKAVIVGVLALFPTSSLFTTAFTPFHVCSLAPKDSLLFPSNLVAIQHHHVRTMALKDSDQNDTSAFWKLQKDLAASMSEAVDQSIKGYEILSQNHHFMEHTLHLSLIKYTH